MTEIRPAVWADLPAIARAHVEADWDTYSALFGAAAYALEPEESEARWRRALKAGDILLVAVAQGGRIVGFGHARQKCIGALYLLASHQRQGIGSALLGGLLAALRQRGVAEAHFDVVAVNANAIRFYRARGATPIGRGVNRDARGDTEDLTLVIPTAPGLRAAR